MYLVIWSGCTSLHFSLSGPFGPRIVSQLVGRLAVCTWLANHREGFSSIEILLHQSQLSAYCHYPGHPFESTFQSVQAQVSLEPLWHSSTHIVSSFWGPIVPPSFQSDWAGWPHQSHDLQFSANNFSSCNQMAPQLVWTHKATRPYHENSARQRVYLERDWEAGPASNGWTLSREIWKHMT